MSSVSSNIAPTGESVGLVIEDYPCDTSVFEGAFVYIESGIANNAIATGITTSRVIGIVEFKPSSTTCNIRIGGIVEDLLTGLDDNVNYFLSDTIAGTVTTSVISGSGKVLMKIGKPITSTIFLLGIELRTIRV